MPFLSNRSVLPRLGFWSLAVLGALGCGRAGIETGGQEEGISNHRPSNPPEPPAPPTGWPQYGHDAQRSGSTTAGPSAAPAVIWTADLPHAEHARLAIDALGHLYVGAWGLLQAFDSNGALRWKHEIDKGYIQGVAITTAGDVVITSQGVLEILSSAGDLLASVPLEGGNPSRPLIGDGDRVYVVADYDGHLQAFSPHGELLWSTSIAPGDRPLGTPAQGPDGALYVPTGSDQQHGLVKVSREGVVLWSKEIDGEFTGTYTPNSVSVRGDGTVLLAHVEARILAFSPEGESLFDTKLMGIIKAPAAFSGSGDIHVGHAWGVSRLTPGGEELWRVGPQVAGDDDLSIWCNIALVSGERVVAASLDGRVSGIADHERLWSVERGPLGAHDSRPQPDLIVGVDGTIYTGSWTERLYAIR